MVIFPMTLTDP